MILSCISLIIQQICLGLALSDRPRSPSSSWLNDFVAYVWTCIVGLTKALKYQCFNDLVYLTDITGTCSIGLLFMRQSLVSSARTGHIFTSASYPQRRVTAGPLMPGFNTKANFCIYLPGFGQGFISKILNHR